MDEFCSASRELTVCCIPSGFLSDVKYKAKCQGVPMNEMVYKIIRETVKGYPDDVKTKIKPFKAEKIKGQHLRIRGGALSTKNNLLNIAKRIGVSPSDFIKVKLYDAMLQMPNNPNFIDDNG